VKDLAINLAAPWVGTFRSWVDGDIFRESNIDTQLGSIGNRLGYLYTQVWGRALLTGDNEFAGNQAWVSGSAIFGVPVEFTQGIDATGSTAVFDHVTAAGLEFLSSHDGLRHRRFILPDATHTLADVNYDHYRVPSLSSSVVYTLTDHADYAGRRVRISRVTVEAFSVRIRRSGTPSTNLITFGSGDKGWCDFEADGSGVWRLAAWYGAATVDTVEV
jgi:hypothetical protein